MAAEITRVEDGTALVSVYDRKQHKHLVEVDVETGEIGRHGQDAYPKPGSAGRTDEHDLLNSQAEARARYEVHSETDHDVLDPEWVPEELERGIQALEAVSAEAFDEGFREYYRVLNDPGRAVREYDFDGRVDDPEVFLVTAFVCVDGNQEVAAVADGYRVDYADSPDGDPLTGGADPTCPDGTTRLPVMLVPFSKTGVDFEYPSEFREMVTLNLVCQVRDVYRHMGEPVPHRFDVDGFGKPEARLNVA